MSLDELYQEVILDHYKKPRCRGCLARSDATSALYNPLCGDKVELTVAVKDGKVEDIAFSGQGCSISQASASMMSELCKGRSLKEAQERLGEFKSLMRGEKNEEELVQLGDVVALGGVRKFSARVKCAMLAWEALEKCIQDLSKI